MCSCLINPYKLYNYVSLKTASVKLYKYPIYEWGKRLHISGWLKPWVEMRACQWYGDLFVSHFTFIISVFPTFKIIKFFEKTCKWQNIKVHGNPKEKFKCLRFENLHRIWNKRAFRYLDISSSRLWECLKIVDCKSLVFNSPSKCKRHCTMWYFIKTVVYFMFSAVFLQTWAAAVLSTPGRHPLRLVPPKATVGTREIVASVVFYSHVFENISK